MKIIPVIDVKDGVVVLARQGDRDQYRPIHTPLCRSSDIHRVILAFLSLYEFDTFYIADLNAIANQGNHDSLINEITSRFADKIFWIDRGCRATDLSEKLPKNQRPVLGSESCHENGLQSLKHCKDRFILSLDYSMNGALGPQDLFSDSSYWPDSLIIMTLVKVGSGKGPDLPLLAEYCRNYPEKHFIAAGGIRSKRDLIDLARTGIHQALVASALHSGAIGSRDIAELDQYGRKTG